MNLNKITIGISTLNDGIYKVILPEERNECEILIVHQVTNSLEEEYTSYIKEISRNRRDLKYIISNEKGLSKSRNLVIKECKTEFLHISDDDVGYEIAQYESIIIEMTESKLDIGVAKISSGNVDFKKYAEKGKAFTKFSAARISSIEMILRVSSIKDNGIEFDTNFGLGSELPSGEELIFGVDAIDRGLSIKQLGSYVCSHPKESTGIQVFTSEKVLRSKKAMFVRAFPIIGRCLFLVFIIKKFRKFLDAGTLNSAIRLAFCE